jgi:hypothetical protein
MRHDRLLPDTLRRSAATRPASFDAGALTVEAVVATASPVPRRDPRGAVFHATRGNIGEPDGVTVAALAAGRKAMRLRTSLDGKTLISATPRYLLVSAEEETEAERVLATIQPNTTEDVNPFSGKLSLLVEPRLPEGTYYLFADPARLPCLQYAYLSAAQGVQIQRTETWDTLGMKFRAFLDFGAGWLDWRGAHKVPGL